MSLERVKAETSQIIQEREERKRELVEYQKECERIFNEVDEANEQVDGGMAVEVVGPNEVRYLVLRAPVTEELETPDFWGCREHHTLFVLSPSEIYALRVKEGFYAKSLEELSPENRTSQLFAQQPQCRILYYGDGSDLQKAIDLSLSKTVPLGPPLSPDLLKSVGCGGKLSNNS